MLSAKPRSASPNFPRPSSKRGDIPGRTSSHSGKPKHDGPHNHDGHHNHDGPHNHDGHTNGYKEEVTVETVEIFTTKTTEEIRRETKEDVTVITAQVLELLTIGETDANGVVIVERGEYFLDSVIRKFQFDFVERWKIECLFPAIKIWIEKHIIEYIERIITITREKIIKEYEEKIIIINREHECEIKRREECQREIYLEVIRKAWLAYSKTMEDIEFVKEVRFKYRAIEEREVWGEFIKELGPELLEHCPRVYKPEFYVEDCRHHPRKE